MERSVKGYLGFSVSGVLSLLILFLLSIEGQCTPPVILRLLLAAKTIRNSNLSLVCFVGVFYFIFFLQIVAAIFFSLHLGNTLVIYDPVQMSYGGASNWNIFL